MDIIRTKQEQMYVDIVQLVADIARESFRVDVINNPYISTIFRQQLEKNHGKLEAFIIKYAPIELPPAVTSSTQEIQVERTLQPVSETEQAS